MIFAEMLLSGTVKDATGGAIANARILILTAQP